MRLIAVATLALFAATCGATAAAARPCVTVPRADTPPVIDGRLGEAAWQGAVAVSGFAVVGASRLAEQGTTAYLAYDDTALYAAFRCQEPERGRPLGFTRAHDDRAFDDDCVQLFVAPEDLRKAKPGRIAFGGYAGAYSEWFADIGAVCEFTVNCRGSRTEARNDVRDWDAPWVAKVSRERGAWSAELAIPWASLGLGKAPVGTLCGLNLYRRRSPDLSGWVGTGFGGYTPLPLGAMLLAEGRPVARLLAVEPPRLGDNALAVHLANPGTVPADVEVSVAPAGGEAVTETCRLEPSQAREVRLAYAISGEGVRDAGYVVRVRGDEVPLLQGSLPLRVPRALSLDLRAYGLAGRVEGCVTLGPGSKAETAVLTLQGGEGTPVEARMDLRGRPGATLRVPLKGAPGERRQAKLQVLAGDGTVLGERSTEVIVPARPAWVGTRAGLAPADAEEPGVLPPWTPMEVEGKSVSMLGRTLVFTDLALPASIVSAGREMLAAPARVVVSSRGREVAWRTRECRVVKSAPGHVWVKSVWRADALELQVDSRLEYDGFCWVEVSLVPRGTARVDRVALEIPLRKEVVRYVYPGHAQSGHALSPKGWRGPLTTNFWVGDESRGLAWAAESLEWVRSTDRRRQLEVTPERDRTLWRTLLIDQPTEMGEAYTASFALHVTPAKPVSLRKSRIFHGAFYGLEEQRNSGTIRIPARGHIDLSRGSLEFWVKPTFDTSETYDPTRERSAYNRGFLTLEGDAGELAMLYYNADDRSLRLVTRNAAGAYPVVLGGRARLPAGEWSYVGLSWGDTLRLSINGTIAEHKARGLIAGGAEGGTLSFSLGEFQVDHLRITGSPRPLDGVPAAPLAADAGTLLFHPFEEPARPEKIAPGSRPISARACATVPGKWGRGCGSGPGTRLDQLAADGTRIVIFHEHWSRYQGYPDLEQVAKLKKIADACHARGMLFLVYFCHMMSDAAPEWPGMENDFMAPPVRKWYHRDDVKQDCYLSCVNGPFGDLLLDGIAKLADRAGIDGVYMDGTTVAWGCANPTHPGCGRAQEDGTYAERQPIRGARRFMKRLRSIFAQRGKEFFLDAHTGGAIQIATQSFCDGYYDGEHLARYKPGFRLSPDTFLTGYASRQFGFRGDFLPVRHSMDEALAVSLVHDTAVRGQPAAVDLAWAPYEEDGTRFVPYWEASRLYAVSPAQVLGSLYLRPDRALLVLGSQTEAESACIVDVSGVLGKLPVGVGARDAVTGEKLSIEGTWLKLHIPGRSWKMVEVK